MDEAVTRYRIALAILYECVKRAAISEDEYEKCRTALAEKYGISSCSIFF